VYSPCASRESNFAVVRTIDRSADLSDNGKTAMQIYIKRNGQRFGPYSLEEINRLLAAGTVNPSELAWHEAAPGWKPLFSIAGVLLPGAASARTISIAIATPNPPEAPRYAGFWIRAVAFMIDSVLVGIAIAVCWFGLWPNPSNFSFSNIWPAAIVVAALKIFYFAGLWASPMQATPGQKLCRLRVVSVRDDPRIRFLRALGRLFAMILSTLMLGIGHIMAAFTERKRALHDIIAGTCVIRVRKVWE
jgi:uncharacterized RDD family membrane protein YckC